MLWTCRPTQQEMSDTMDVGDTKLTTALDLEKVVHELGKSRSWKSSRSWNANFEFPPHPCLRLTAALESTYMYNSAIGHLCYYDCRWTTRLRICGLWLDGRWFTSNTLLRYHHSRGCPSLLALWVSTPTSLLALWVSTPNLQAGAVGGRMRSFPALSSSPSP